MPRPTAAALASRGAALALAATALGACSPRLAVARRPATPSERTAVVECASAIVTDAGFVVTERRTDLGRLSASSAPARGADGTAAFATGAALLPLRPAAPPPARAVDELTIAISKHPLTDGLALLVSATAHAGDSPRAPSEQAAVTRDRILQSCAYLVG